MGAETQQAEGVSNRYPYERKGILFVVSAPSGAGKTTLCKRVVASISGLWHSVSYTTRKPRMGEEGGREYYFVEEQVFQDMIARQEFLEYARVYGNWYGTPRKVLMDKLAQGIDVLLEIDVQGALQIKKNFEDAVLIFILPPSLDTLRDRLEKRGSDSPEEIHRRLQKVQEEVRSFRDYCYLVLNDDLGQSLRELQSIFLAERLRTGRIDTNWLNRLFSLDGETVKTDQHHHSLSSSQEL
ncbi:MAG: guanylate kinase [Nitrospira sp.]|nr:guanylate kinase [Nitrospira sp.]